MDEQTNPKVGTGGKEALDQIRDIIFGDSLLKIQTELENLRKQIKDLEKSIGNIKNEGAEMTKELRAGTIEEIQKVNESAKERQDKIQASMNSLAKTVKSQLKKLDETKVDKSKIGQVFMEWGQKMNELQS